MIEPRRVLDFDTFYRAEWGRLAGTMRLLSGEAMTADEIAQETFTRAWMHWTHVSQLERPQGWLYTTAFRLLRRRLKRESRPSAPSRSFDAAELDLTDRVALEHALAALPVRQRQAVVARHVLGFTGPEAAALLGLRPDNFRQLLSRALRDLRVSPELVDLP